MKLMIMGHGRHGKDTVCEILRDEYGYTFESSSMAAAKHAIYPALKHILGYHSLEDCYNDRGNHRALWFELIKAFNHHDGARLARLIYMEKDIYNGVRNAEEFFAIKRAGLFHYSVWVDASKRVPPETTDSCTVTRDMADFTLSNNGSEADLERNIAGMLAFLRDRHRMKYGRTLV